MSLGMFDNEQPRQRRNDEIRMSKETTITKLQSVRRRGAIRGYSRLKFPFRRRNSAPR